MYLPTGATTFSTTQTSSKFYDFVAAFKKMVKGKYGTLLYPGPPYAVYVPKTSKAIAAEAATKIMSAAAKVAPSILGGAGLDRIAEFLWSASTKRKSFAAGVTKINEAIKVAKGATAELTPKESWDYWRAMEAAASNFDIAEFSPSQGDLYLEAWKETLEEIASGLPSFRIPWWIWAGTFGLAALWVVQKGKKS